MVRSFKEAILNRRTSYNLSAKSTLKDEEIKKLLEFALLNVPSAFNSQSTRLVLLLGDNHTKLWNDIVLDALRPLTPPAVFGNTEQKVKGAFASGYGTILFFEDSAVIEFLQEKFPLYKDNFPVFSQHTCAMHQFAVWNMLEDAGMGASLQHYNPIIDDAVKTQWDLPQEWQLVAQMPFGVSTTDPGPKEFGPIEPRLKIFK